MKPKPCRQDACAPFLAIHTNLPARGKAFCCLVPAKGRRSDSRNIAGMESVELATVQPAVTVEEIDEPTVAGAGIELLDLDAVQLQSLPFRV